MKESSHLYTKEIRTIKSVSYWHTANSESGSGMLVTDRTNTR
jgi:hypothetical protein